MKLNDESLTIAVKVDQNAADLDETMEKLNKVDKGQKQMRGDVEYDKERNGKDFGKVYKRLDYLEKQTSDVEFIIGNNDITEYKHLSEFITAT